MFFSCHSTQLRRSSSRPSILRCQSMTDIPRDVTSTSLPPCPLFTCKSNCSGARARPNILTLSCCRLYLRASLMRLHQTHQLASSLAPRDDTDQAPELPSARGHRASSSWVPGASLCLLGSKAVALQMRNMSRMSETRK